MNYFYRACVVLLFPMLGGVAHAQSSQDAALVLDQKLENLYQEVGIRFQDNPQFKNEANPNLYLPSGGSAPLPPEYHMPSLDTFKVVMKSYCKLFETPAKALVNNANRYAFVDYTQNALVRRFYVYDVSTHTVIHNTWGTHAELTARARYYNMSMANAALDPDSVLGISDYNTSHFFSNRNGSNLSTLGMTVASANWYSSSGYPPRALQLQSADPLLNSNIFKRSIVIHPYGTPKNPFNSEFTRLSQILAVSNGCLMFSRDDFFEGVMHANVADAIIDSVKGAPVLLYHERMISSEMNESTYQSDLADAESFKVKMESRISTLGQSRYLPFFEAKFKSEFSDLVEETHQYFKQASSVVGVPLDSFEQCANLLGI